MQGDGVPLIETEQRSPKGGGAEHYWSLRGSVVVHTPHYYWSVACPFATLRSFPRVKMSGGWKRVGERKVRAQVVWI